MNIKDILLIIAIAIIVVAICLLIPLPEDACECVVYQNVKVTVISPDRIYTEIDSVCTSTIENGIVRTFNLTK